MRLQQRWKVTWGLPVYGMVSQLMMFRLIATDLVTAFKTALMFDCSYSAKLRCSDAMLSAKWPCRGYPWGRAAIHMT